MMQNGGGTEEKHSVLIAFMLFDVLVCPWRDQLSSRALVLGAKRYRSVKHTPQFKWHYTTAKHLPAVWTVLQRGAARS